MGETSFERVKMLRARILGSLVQRSRCILVKRSFKIGLPKQSCFDVGLTRKYSMFYLCIATTGCLYITSQWLLLWYSESLLESQNDSDLEVASKSKRRPCRKIEE